MDALVTQNLAPEEARERRGERERERAVVAADREREDGAVARARVDVGRRSEPHLQDAREEDRRADVGAADLYVGEVKRKS